MEKIQYNTEERLIEFTVKIVELEKQIPNTRSGNTMANQIVRSGSSPSLNYGEALGAESKKDMKHKFRIILKELKETNISLKIIKRANMYRSEELIEWLNKETGELIAIFTKSIKTLECTGR